jgi:NAD(P)-dependent dehydrogenase (short-subunit alcohol dehydrogenase family)
VNNAGMGVHASFAQTTEAQFDELMNTHLKGTFFLTQKLLPLIADGGRILNVSSGLARFAIPGYAAYAAMKGGMRC